MTAPRLNIHCKSLFIIHQRDKVFVTKEDDKVPASEFFKCLLISRQFVRASQMYNIYELKVGEFCDNSTFNLRLSHYYKNPQSKNFQLTLEEIQQLNQLLNVQYVDVFEYDYSHADQYSAMCKIFKGKFGLRLRNDNSENEVHHHGIINQVKDQLFLLKCNVKSLLGSPEVSCLTLNYCACWKVENFYQIKKVLTDHRIKRLFIGNVYEDSAPRFDEIIAEDYFDDFPMCPCIKKVDFMWAQLDENYKLLPKLIKMISFFPNLTEIECYFNSRHYTSEQFSSQKLVDRVTNEYEMIEQLRKTCPVNTTIKLTYIFLIRRAEPLILVKQTIKHILKKTKFNQLHFFKDAAKEVTNDDVVSIRYYYYVIIKWKEPNFKASLSFEGDLDPLTMGDNELIEEDDNLLVPLFDEYESD